MRMGRKGTTSYLGTEKERREVMQKGGRSSGSKWNGRKEPKRGVRIGERGSVDGAAVSVRCCCCYVSVFLSHPIPSGWPFFCSRQVRFFENQADVDCLEGVRQNHTP